MATKRRNNRAFNIIRLNRINSEKKLFLAYDRSLQSMLKKVAASGKTKAPTVTAISKQLIKDVTPAYKFVARSGFAYGIKQVEDAVGQPISNFIAKATEEDLLALGIPSVQKEVVSSGMKKVKSVSKTFHKRMQKQMTLSIDANESRDALAKRIKGLTGVTKSQAQGIARTETTKVFNAGQLAGYEKSRITDGKEWVTNIMGNPRHPPESQFDHLGANGEKVKLDKPFVRTGESLMHPGDSSGSAGNVIRCECAMTPVINLKKPGSKIPPDELSQEVLDSYKPAKTLKEAEAFAKNSLGITENTSGLNLDGLNAVNKAMFEVKKGWVIPITKYKERTGITSYAAATHDELHLNKFYFNDLDTLDEIYRLDVKSGFHPSVSRTKDNIKAIIDHEVAHSMTLVDRGNVLIVDHEITSAIGNIQKNQIKAISAQMRNEELPWIKGKGWDVTKSKYFISEYTKKGKEEFIAESFTQVLNAKKPSKYAKEVVDIMKEKYGVKK